MVPASRPPNRFLQALSGPDFDLLRSHLRLTKLDQHTTLFMPGKKIEKVYFPHSGLISFVVSLKNGGAIETGMVGHDSLAGTTAAFDLAEPIYGAVVQIAGDASTVDAPTFRAAAAASVSFRAMVYRHDQMVLAQAQQSVACASKHDAEERFCRWLLRIRDIIGSDDIALTQEYLAEMMGVRRTSVTLIARSIQAAGLIKYRRAHIQITDLEGLRDAVCECYEAVANLEGELTARSDSNLHPIG